MNVLCFTGLFLSRARPLCFVVHARAPAWHARPLPQTTPVDGRRDRLILFDRDRSPPVLNHALAASSSDRSIEPLHRCVRSRGCENRASSACVRCKRNSDLAQLTLSRSGKVSTSCRDNLSPVSISS